jgi:hypothetical protein
MKRGQRYNLWVTHKGMAELLRKDVSASAAIGLINSYNVPDVVEFSLAPITEDNTGQSEGLKVMP